VPFVSESWEEVIDEAAEIFAMIQGRRA